MDQLLTNALQTSTEEQKHIFLAFIQHYQQAQSVDLSTQQLSTQTFLPSYTSTQVSNIASFSNQENIQTIDVVRALEINGDPVNVVLGLKSSRGGDQVFLVYENQENFHDPRGFLFNKKSGPNLKPDGKLRTIFLCSKCRSLSSRFPLVYKATDTPILQFKGFQLTDNYGVHFDPCEGDVVRALEINGDPVNVVLGLKSSRGGDQVFLVYENQENFHDPRGFLFNKKSGPNLKPDGKLRTIFLCSKCRSLSSRFPLVYKATDTPILQFKGFQLTDNYGVHFDPCEGYSLF
uniref:DUF295 domain-containing protein n=1 Tax=Rhabditophanes sp. KR3021 TaxID=114890 RepID=A0AC35UBJ1_9BILA